MTNSISNAIELLMLFFFAFMGWLTQITVGDAASAGKSLTVADAADLSQFDYFGAGKIENQPSTVKL